MFKNCYHVWSFNLQIQCNKNFNIVAMKLNYFQSCVYQFIINY